MIDYLSVDFPLGEAGAATVGRVMLSRQRDLAVLQQLLVSNENWDDRDALLSLSPTTEFLELWSDVLLLQPNYPKDGADVFAIVSRVLAAKASRNGETEREFLENYVTAAETFEAEGEESLADVLDRKVPVTMPYATMLVAVDNDVVLGSSLYWEHYNDAELLIGNQVGIMESLASLLAQTRPRLHEHFTRTMQRLAERHDVDALLIMWPTVAMYNILSATDEWECHDLGDGDRSCFKRIRASGPFRGSRVFMDGIR